MLLSFPTVFSRCIRFILICLAITGIFSGSSARAQDMGSNLHWTHDVLKDHPLVGIIWDTEAEKSLTLDELLAAVFSSKYLLLGEKHDNKDHHRLQTIVIRELVERKLLGSLSFEMFSTADAARLGSVYQKQFTNFEQVFEFLNEDYKEGFPLKDYRSILQEAWNARVPLKSANLSRTQVRQLVGSGDLSSIFSADELETLGLNQALPESLRGLLYKDIDENHCGHAPASLIEKMIPAQQAKDALMADALLSGDVNGVRVLIAGGGHARKDYGAPRYLALRKAQGEVISIDIREVEPKLHKAGDYIESQGIFDFLWFTPRLELVDACEKYSKALEKLKKLK